MKDIDDSKRGARFCCALVLVRDADNATPPITEGYWRGRILREPQGENGFGYDPLFFVPERGCASAELNKTEKAALSHRGQALRELLRRLPEKFPVVTR